MNVLVRSGTPREARRMIALYLCRVLTLPGPVFALYASLMMVAMAYVYPDLYLLNHIDAKTASGNVFMR